MLSKYQHAVTIMAVVFLAGGIFMYTMGYLGRMHAAMKFGPMTSAKDATPGMEKQVNNALAGSYASVGGIGGTGSSNKSDNKTGTQNLVPGANGESNSKDSKDSDKTKNIPKTKININTADAKLLDELPGVGPVLAERIVQYRESNGFFSKPEELVNVKGIGEKKLKDILPYVRVN